MRRLIPPLLIVACLATLLGLSFGTALFRGEQFAFRDAAQFYYPLYQRVQAEWNAGRWPLWEPEENGGMPLLGNPTAAVLYPPKILYALLSYPWAARLYVVCHTVLAWGAMFLLLRGWQISRTGSAIGALSYAFAAPILFQYCNIVYLVGAAWLPLGFRAVDRWLRLGRRGALLELAAVLALQVLGGEPESAYVLGVCAGGYALGLTWQRGLPPGAIMRLWTWKTAFWASLAVVVWISATLFMAYWAPTQRLHTPPPRPLPWMDWVYRGDLILWGLIGLGIVARRIRRGPQDRLGTMLVELGAAAVLASALAAAQLLPVLEFTSRSLRAADGGANDIFPYSVEVQRLIEFLWPNFYGDSFTRNRSWYMIVPPMARHQTMWVPSLYLGGLTLLLALGALGLRGGPPWRAWLTVIAAVTLVASLGQFSSPLWWARWIPGVEEWIGPHEPLMTSTLRQDYFLRDGDGSVYWFLAVFLPGFRQFRFASKLLTFTTLALTALAGYGWDRVAARPDRRTARLAAVFLALTVVALTIAVAFRSPIIARFEAGTGTEVLNPFGPIDAQGSYNELCWALGQALVVLAITTVLARYAWRRPELAGMLTLVVVTADLGVANTRYVLTLPQRVLDSQPKVVDIIEDAERKDPAGEPFRVHRMPLWNPSTWTLNSSDLRIQDWVTWEHETIQPKHGINYQIGNQNIQYTSTEGTTELYDLKWFFAGFTRRLRPEMASVLGRKPGEEVVYMPRRGFDLWNSRYFILPYYSGGWTDELRGFVAFLDQAERIYPTKEMFQGSEGKAREERWTMEEDYQIYRNKAVYPRAWIVHQARFHTPVEQLDRWERTSVFQEMQYPNDMLWKDPTRTVYNPRVMAWIDANQRSALHGYFPGTLPQPGESVTIPHYSPQRVELDAVLEQPGLVILADVHYPGWKLTVDGKPAPIIRANFLMRGAALDAGKHHLVYTYEPASFYVGLWISAGGLIAFGILGLVFWRRPRSAAS
jgi:hypothetical protein